MKINRSNYEEYFLLYADNELSAADKKLVEVFVEANKDLAEELSIMQDLKLSPEEFDYPFKADLVKAVETEKDTEQLLLYIDGELNSELINTLEEKLSKDDHLAKEYASLQRLKLPIEHIVFREKQSLYKRKSPVFVLSWLRYAAAAAVFVAGLWWAYRFSTGIDDVQQIVETKSSKNENFATRGNIPAKKDVASNPIIVSANDGAPIKHQQIDVQTVVRPVAKASVEEKENNVEKIDISTPQAGSYGTRVPVIDQSTVLEERADLAHLGEVVSQQKPAVKPLILDQSVFDNKKDEVEGREIPFNEVDNNEKNNRKMRGLLRRASRFVNGPESENSDVILVGGFEVAKK